MDIKVRKLFKSMIYICSNIKDIVWNEYVRLIFIDFVFFMYLIKER